MIDIAHGHRVFFTTRVHYTQAHTMPRYLTQNPNVLRPVPYVQPQAQSLIEGISQVRKINLAPGTVKGYHIKQEKWKKWYDGKGFTLK